MITTLIIRLTDPSLADSVVKARLTQYGRIISLYIDRNTGSGRVVFSASIQVRSIFAQLVSLMIWISLTQLILFSAGGNSLTLQLGPRFYPGS
jgi:hypothetical protein